MEDVICTIWKDGENSYRITVNHIYYRDFLNTAVITNIDLLFAEMNNIKFELLKRGLNALFDIADISKAICKS